MLNINMLNIKSIEPLFFELSCTQTDTHTHRRQTDRQTDTQTETSTL